MSTIRLYDFTTKAITEILADELAPGYVRARVEGIEGDVFVEAAGSKLGDIKHDPFSPEVSELLQIFATTFHDVYPCTVEQWEDGFRRG